MSPWNWRNPCTSAATDSDESPQTPSPIRKLAENGVAGAGNQRVNGRQHKSYTGTAENIYPNPNFNTTKKHTTPVLFSTNRGLHLRVAKRKPKPWSSTEACMCGGAAGPKCNALNISECSFASECGSGTRLPTSCAYEIHFCDLERWSTNRANTISLEDTFIVSRRNNSLDSHNVSYVERESNGLNGKNQRSGSIFYVPSGSRHALVMPRRSLYQRSTSIQSTFERFGVQ